VAVKRQQNAIAVIDIPSATLSTQIPLSAEISSMVWATGSGGVSRILADAFEQGVFVINPSANNFIGTVPCPGIAGALTFNPFNQTTYAYEFGRAELCTITPDFTAGSPLSLPKVPPNGVLVVLDNGEQGTIVAGDPTLVIDLRSAGVQTYQQAALGSVIVIGVPSPDRRSVYLESGGGSGRTGMVQRYVLSFGPDGSPQFTQQAAGPSGVLATVDDRFLYTASIVGTCSTGEGPIPCWQGFQVLDAYTLEPRMVNNTFVMGQQVVALATGSYEIPPVKP
jgi:hypothetical protein